MLMIISHGMINMVAGVMIKVVEKVSFTNFQNNSTSDQK